MFNALGALEWTYAQRAAHFWRTLGPQCVTNAILFAGLSAAGLWAHYADRTRHVVEPGDIAEALNAASAIDDDRMQRASQGYVVPESFTHGSSEQRSHWFQQGLTQGKIQGCDTFAQ